jgi:nitrogen fixation protein NifQ
LFARSPKLTVNAALDHHKDHGAAGPSREAACDGCDKGGTAASAYQSLTGLAPENAAVENDEDFDKHVLASILALALTEGSGVAERAGLPPEDLDALLAQWFSQSDRRRQNYGEGYGELDREEIEMVRDLLLANRSSQGDIGRWLAAMVARRAMEPRHLWEDLGLRNRSELTRLLTRHFRPLADRNNKNMRWKRFFYRMMCEDDGFVMCSTPICTNCADYNLCFGEESGESRLLPGRGSTDQFRV